jgi:hypothetical protein
MFLLLLTSPNPSNNQITKRISINARKKSNVMFFFFQSHPLSYNVKRYICQQNIEFVTCDATMTFS